MDNDASQEHLEWSVGEITLGKENAEKKLCQPMEVGCAKGGRERGRERERDFKRGTMHDTRHNAPS